PRPASQAGALHRGNGAPASCRHGRRDAGAPSLLAFVLRHRGAPPSSQWSAGILPAWPAGRRRSIATRFRASAQRRPPSSQWSAGILPAWPAGRRRSIATGDAGAPSLLGGAWCFGEDDAVAAGLFGGVERGV